MFLCMHLNYYVFVSAFVSMLACLCVFWTPWTLIREVSPCDGPDLPMAIHQNQEYCLLIGLVSGRESSFCMFKFSTCNCCIYLSTVDFSCIGNISQGVCFMLCTTALGGWCFAQAYRHPSCFGLFFCPFYALLSPIAVYCVFVCVYLLYLSEVFSKSSLLLVDICCFCVTEH